MRKLLFIAAVFTFVGFANAQQKPNTAQPVEVVNNLDRMQTELGLSATQKAEILAIYEKYTAKKSDIRATGTAKDFQLLNEQRQKEIDALLTAEQLQKRQALEKAKEQMKVSNSSVELK